jgi:hypothetical protein
MADDPVRRVLLSRQPRRHNLEYGQNGPGRIPTPAEFNAQARARAREAARVGPLPESGLKRIKPLPKTLVLVNVPAKVPANVKMEAFKAGLIPRKGKKRG